MTLESRLPALTILSGPNMDHVLRAALSSKSSTSRLLLLPEPGAAIMQRARLMVPDSRRQWAKPKRERHWTAKWDSMPAGVSGALPVGGPPGESSVN